MKKIDIIYVKTCIHVCKNTFATIFLGKEKDTQQISILIFTSCIIQRVLKLK